MIYFFILGVELNKPTHFTVNTKAAGKAKLDAQFTGANKGEVVRDFEIVNNHDGTHTVKYTPVQQVSILNDVLVAEQNIVDSFF